MNVFDELRELERRGERFDTIVLDPPAFAKNKAAVPKALSGYKEINLRALKLLPPGGLPGHVQLLLQRQRGGVRRRARRRRRRRPRRVTVVEKRMQGRDHPVLLTVPETLLPEVLHPAKAGVIDAESRRRQELGSLEV